MKKSKDLTNQTFGKLTALKLSGVDKWRGNLWTCRCVCGAEIVVKTKSLTTGHTKSCGCTRKMELEGQRFGRLTVVERIGKRCENVDWKCLCDCGNFHNVITKYLKGRYVTSCGCAQRDATRVHDKSRGVWKTPEYRAYHGAKRRCQNPKDKDYKDWGGRGIEFRFNSFQEFLDAIGYRPSKYHSNDRIDNDGHYETGNVMWATKQQQANNRRNSCEALNKRIAELEAENKALRQQLTHSINADTIEVDRIAGLAMTLSQRIHPLDLGDIFRCDKNPGTARIVKNENYFHGQIVIYKGKRYEQSLEVPPVRKGAIRFIKENGIRLSKKAPFVLLTPVR